MGSPAGLNFVFDLALLWAAGHLRGAPVRWERLTLGALAGTLYFLLAPRPASPLGMAASLVAASALMVGLAYRARSLRAFAQLLLAFYGVVCLAGGAGALAAGVFGSGQRPDPLAGSASAMATIALLGAAGLPAARRAVLTHALRVRLRLRFADRWVTMTGMVDTGNRLREPMGQLPVILVDLRPVQEVVPPELQGIVGELARGNLSRAGRLAALDPRWAARFRLVPFRSIGTEHGLLAAFRSDEAELSRPGRPPVRVGPVVAALSPAFLLAETGFEALVPADCLLGDTQRPTRDDNWPVPAMPRGGAADAATG